MATAPFLITLAQTAQMTGLSVAAVRKHLEDVVHPLPVAQPSKGKNPSLLDAHDVHRYYVDKEFRRKRRTTPSGATEEVLDFNKARARKEQAQADQTTFNLRVALGEFVPVEDAQLAYAAGLQEVASQLDAASARIKRQLPELSHAQMDVIEREIARARNTAADKAGQGFDTAQSA